tara:strand:+ start:714 stop:1310 length:597 start_codon:yes stop_codon:yes gene_type:complete
MTERTVNIDNFIATYDGYVPDIECKKAISLFEKQSKFSATVNRQEFEKISVLKKQDQQFFSAPGNLEVWHQDTKALLANFDIALKHYEINTGIKEVYDIEEFKYTALKIQKTLPTEGYHLWHLEWGPLEPQLKRGLVFSIYLNEVEEGGETEFLHFSKRVKPKTGRIVIWPAAFPYIHRGNPPLTGEKYILTSWLLVG